MSEDRVSRKFRRIDDKPVGRDAEDRRYRVDRENKVRDIDDDQNQQQQRAGPLAVVLSQRTYRRRNALRCG